PGEELVRRLEEDGRGFHGRVGFLRMETPFPRAPVPPANLETDARVMGRADRFVEVSEEYTPLVQRLLGQTYFVESLGDALSLAASCEPGWAFVTVAGELVNSDGGIVVGPRNSATGLISRRSELRALEDQIGQMEAKVDRRAADLEGLEEEISRHETAVERLADQHARLSGTVGEQRLRTASLGERLEQIGRQRTSLDRQRQATVSRRDAALVQKEDARRQLAAMEAEFANLEAQLQNDSQAIEELGDQRGRVQQLLTERQVAFGKSEQQLAGLREQMRRFQCDHEERSHGLAEVRTQLEVCQQRARDAQRNILRLESETAELYLAKERISAEVIDHRNRLETHRLDRSRAIAEAGEMRQQVRALDKGVVQREIEIAQLQQQRNMLANRIREDYQIELAELEQEPSPEALRQREAVEREIAELRQKINNIGSVNLDALDELDELESRFASLSAQHADLEKAKGSLQQIIGRINADSRRLFADTLDTVRGHFQSLFVKLFGGGQADIVLDGGEEVDLLESGIEIVARPPGKEPRSISLLSGGEKTLTCVALLLAIFRSRPSPFCVLDEVDAALDEANIERFTAVITEFLASTQFIVITHSKKTMTAANTLYGITMQESGVSKRVSVRFEDVHDDGQIRETAAAASGDPDPSATDGPEDDETRAA
ncbi:MAG: chromosome segregation protein SMC, partial [Pirellulales bacterium]